jgi:hypothetical protein
MASAKKMREMWRVEENLKSQDRKYGITRQIVPFKGEQIGEYLVNFKKKTLELRMYDSKNSLE